MGWRLDKQVNQEIDAENFQAEINSRIQSQIGVRHRVGRDVGEVWNRVNLSTNFIKAIIFCNFLPLFKFFCGGLPASWVGGRALNLWIFLFRVAEIFFLCPYPSLSLKSMIMFTQSGFLKTNFTIHGEENRTQRTCTIFMKALFCSFSFYLLPFPGKRSLYVWFSSWLIMPLAPHIPAHKYFSFQFTTWNSYNWSFIVHDVKSFNF